MKSEEGKLLFLVPYSTNVGLQKLVISSLNNTTIQYVIKETILTNSPEETLTPFFNNINTFKATLDTSPEAIEVLNTLNSFSDVFNNATIEQKKQMAILYKANKIIFDNILLDDFSHVTVRNVTPNDLLMLAKHSYGVYLMAGGAIVAIYAPLLTDKAIGVLVASVGAYKAYKYYKEFIEENLNTTNVSVDEVLGTNDRSINNTQIILQNDVVKTVNFKIKTRKLITSDANKTLPNVVSFFSVHNKYNYLVNKMNTVIGLLNSNLPFANFSQVPLEVMPDSALEIDENVSNSIFNKINFTLNHANLQLVSTSLQSDGQLNLKVKIIGTPSSQPIESYLNYSYNDEFSSFTGKLPIKVSNPPATLTGVTFFNRYNVGTICSNLNHSCSWEMHMNFSGSVPIGDYLKIRTVWDDQGDGNFEGNLNGSFATHTIDAPNVTGLIYKNHGGFCWGTPTTVLKIQYRHVTAAGIEGPVLEAIVPR